MSSKFDFGARIKATSYDDLTGASGAQPSDAVRSIPIAKLHPFKMHPFKVLDNEDMEALTESVKENGILTPLTVRKDCGSDGMRSFPGIAENTRQNAPDLRKYRSLFVDMVRIRSDQHGRFQFTAYQRSCRLKRRFPA